MTEAPDFQRSWVWDENHIKSLIASVSLAFPVGAALLRGSKTDPHRPYPQTR